MSLQLNRMNKNDNKLITVLDIMNAINFYIFASKYSLVIYNFYLIFSIGNFSL